MKSMNRRGFFSGAAASLAVLVSPTVSAQDARLLDPSDWKMAAFDQLIKHHYEVKQLFDVTEVDDGSVFFHMLNCLEGLQVGFGIANDKIKIVGALRAKATVMNFNDSLWEKYKLGESLKINDPQTGKPATRNIFYAGSTGGAANHGHKGARHGDPAEEDSSIRTLQARGVQLLACHMAIRGQSGFLAKKFKLKQEDVLNDLQGNLLPGVLIVPSGVSAIAVLESKGHFGYLRM
jgi:intracellular sulfur oxidation DsrE/DsrF family protein